MTKNTLHTEIIIVGAGMVGLVLALALARAGVNVVVIEARSPILQWDDAEPSARVSVINLASERILAQLEILPHISQKALARLARLKVWDGVGNGEIEFDASDIGKPSLGSIVDNREVIKVAWQQLQAFDNVQCFVDQAPDTLYVSDDFAKIELADGTDIAAPLCVGADGARSWVRAQVDAEVRERSYQQKALIAVVQTELEHQNTGWQVFMPTGPLALLPLSDRHQCAIVWTHTPEQVDQLAQMNLIEFECEINSAFGLGLGEIKLLGGRQVFPLTMRHARDYIQPRVALAGDAAHTIHPLAGQGVNLGFLDAACLADCILSAREKNADIGALKPLRRYERWRKGDNTEMLLAMRAFKDLFSSTAAFTVQARSYGFNALDRLPWAKRCFMGVALAQKGDLPSLAQ